MYIERKGERENGHREMCRADEREKMRVLAFNYDHLGRMQTGPVMKSSGHDM